MPKTWRMNPNRFYKVEFWEKLSCPHHSPCEGSSVWFAWESLLALRHSCGTSSRRRQLLFVASFKLTVVQSGYDIMDESDSDLMNGIDMNWHLTGCIHPVQLSVDHDGHDALGTCDRLWLVWDWVHGLGERHELDHYFQARRGSLDQSWDFPWLMTSLNLCGMYCMPRNLSTSSTRPVWSSPDLDTFERWTISKISYNLLMFHG